LSTHRKRHVEPIIDEDLGREFRGDGHQSADEVRQAPGIQIAFSHLNQIDPGSSSGPNLGHETFGLYGRVGVRTESAAVGDQAEQSLGAHEARIEGRSCEDPTDSLIRRAMSRSARSRKPVRRLTIPRPDTAPRRKLFRRMGSSAGNDWAK
jgi:hypothetical protein